MHAVAHAVAHAGSPWLMLWLTMAHPGSRCGSCCGVLQVVPVYPLAPAEDSLLFAVDKCPAFNARLEEYYQSEKFQNWTRDSEALRSSFASFLPGWDLSMKNMYNM